MARTRRIMAWMLIPLLLNGCPAVILGGATTAGYVGVQERSIGNAVDDTGILAHIKSLYLQSDVNTLFHGISVEVTEGRVLLTGQVPTPEARVEAVKLAWQPSGVKEVINEIQIAEGYSIKQYARDAYISTRVRGRLLISKNVRSINYNVDTVKNVVYLMGIAHDQKELDIAISLAKAVDGVKQVISHVMLKDSAKRIQ